MRPLKNNRGFSLVEMLAVLVLISTITLLSINIISSATNQQIKQNNYNRDIQDLSYALKFITKDIRKSDAISKTEDSTDPNIIYYNLTLKENMIATYWLENNEIIRSTPLLNESIALNISEFTINSGSISITTLNENTVTTDITLRSGKNETLKHIK